MLPGLPSAQGTASRMCLQGGDRARASLGPGSAHSIQAEVFEDRGEGYSEVMVEQDGPSVPWGVPDGGPNPTRPNCLFTQGGL